MATIKFTDLSQSYDPVQSGVIPFVDISGGNTHYKVSQYDLTKKPCFLAYATGSNTQVVTGNSYVIFHANNEQFDSHGYYNASIQRFTPLKSGYYKLEAQNTYLNFLAGNSLNLEILKNGTVISQDITYVSSGNAQLEFAKSSIIAYANGTTDYFTTEITHSDTTATRSVQSNINGYSFFLGYGI